MSRPVYIDCGVQNSQMIIGQNNASTIILGNSTCITSITGLMNASNASFNNLSVTSLYISGQTYGGTTSASSNMTLTNVSVNGQLYLYVGNTSMTDAIISAPNVSHNNVYAASNFSMPTGSLMNVSNASFDNVSINLLKVSTMDVSNISTNSLDTNNSGTLNIGNTNASTINIGTLGRGTINIGKSNMSTVIQGPLVANGLNMNTGKNITLQPASGFVIPTNSQLGFFLSSNTILNISFSSTATNITSLIIPTVGYWLLSGSMTFYGSGTGINLRYSVDSSNAIQVIGNPVSSYAGVTLPIFVYYNTNASTTIYTQASNNGNTNSVYVASFTAIRIA